MLSLSTLIECLINANRVKSPDCVEMRSQVMPYERSMTVFALSCIISRCLELILTLPQNTRTRYYSHCHKYAHAVLLMRTALKLPQNTRTRYYSHSRKTRAPDITHTAKKHAQAEYLPHNSMNLGLQVRMVLWYQAQV